MSDKIESLFQELSQICTQYKAEVPGRRRAWPESIKERVFSLRNYGVSWSKITERTGISYQTMIVWKQPATSFSPVKVVESKKPMTVTVREKLRPKAVAKALTVTVITPSGYRIEGLDQRSALTLIEKLHR